MRLINVVVYEWILKDTEQYRLLSNSWLQIKTCGCVAVFVLFMESIISLVIIVKRCATNLYFSENINTFKIELIVRKAQLSVNS